MKSRLVMLFCSLFVCSVLAQTSEPLSAQYEITVKQRQQDHPESVRHLTLWRMSSSQVIHQFQQQELSQYWTLQKNQRVKLIKLFDAHHRGIEYAASDIKGHQQRDWSEKYQLLSDTFLASLQKSKTYQDAAWGQVEVLVSQAESRTIVVEWLPAYRLIKSINTQDKHRSENWQLNSISMDGKSIQKQMQSWDKYYLTDYADIGDNESDPFLMQMINLGFVEAAASGFYNDKGQQIKGQHNHHH